MQITVNHCSPASGRYQDRITAPLIQGMLRLLARLPLPLCHRLGTALGGLCAVLPNGLRRIAETNLGLCFPDMPQEQRRRLLRRSLMETGRTFSETGALWFWDRDRVLALVRKVSGEELLKQALAHGTGVILVAPHLGAWELAGLYCSVRCPLTSLYRPPRIAALDHMMRRARERLGARLVPTDTQGIRAMLQALRQGEAVGILPDQDPRRDQGVFVPFFGIPTHTMTLVSRLAAKTGASVLFVYAKRLGGGNGYELNFIAAPEGVADTDRERAAAQLNSGIECCVRAAPEQYLWVYKRFKTRPPGGQRYY
jgi:KDO2-lipid IV(A) lauroyltransferase